MFIEKINIENIRNLESISLKELATLNFLVGPNGSGKTSILESISIASQGRSFRNNKVQTVINQEQSALSVFLECKDNTEKAHKIGIHRDRKNNYKVRIDGGNAATLAELSSTLPTVSLDATAFELLDGSSSIRRKFVDWGVFHVEHSFYERWKIYNKALKQRNTLLKSGQNDYLLYEPWDKELVNSAIELERLRLSYLKTFKTIFIETLSFLDSSLTSDSIYYKNGWGLEKIEFKDLDNIDGLLPEESTLREALKSQFERDCKYQRTHIGAHRADILLKSGRNDVRDIYSRGQKKTIVAALKLAQAKVVKNQTKKLPVLLLDDLPSELDDQHLSRFLEFVVQESYQAFITAVDDRIFVNNNYVNARMFHVERGKIDEFISADKADGRSA